MDYSSEEYVVQYRQGDTHAIEKLIERHTAGVYAFTRRMLGNDTDAEDATQEVFVKVWRSLHTYKATSGSFKTWLMRIARNTVIDMLRKKKHIPLSQFDDEEGGNPLLDTLADTEALPDELFIQKENVTRVTEAIETLDAIYREVLSLYYTSGMTFEEIGSSLDTSVHTIKSRHRRALLALRKVLSGHAPKDE